MRISLPTPFPCIVQTFEVQTFEEHLFQNTKTRRRMKIHMKTACLRLHPLDHINLSIANMNNVANFWGKKFTKFSISKN
jgi:hypothetical protein